VKILFLADAQPDYLQDIVFDGIVRVLGHENVFDFPPLDRYHAVDLPEDRHPTWYFAVPGGRSAPLAELAADADAIVVGSVRPGIVAHVRRLLDLRTGKPIAYLDGEDDPFVRSIAREVDVYCKRETLARPWPARFRMTVAPDRRTRRLRKRADPLAELIGVARPRAARILPLPLGIVDVGFVPAQAKRYDICFLYGLSNQRRVATARALRALRAEGWRVCVPDERPSVRLPWSVYMRVLSQSRIGVSVRGFGYDTYRYWEVPYADTLLLAERPRTIIPDNFIDGVEAVFAPCTRMAAVARQLLSRDVSEIANRGRGKLLRKHTSVQRALAVLEALDTVRRSRTTRRPLQAKTRAHG
jgi:hypothetical protein